MKEGKTSLYILQSISHPEKFYLGISDRKEERLAEHNRGQTVSTRKNKPWRCIYVEEYGRRRHAMRREKYLKSIKGYKERLQLIEQYKE